MNNNLSFKQPSSIKKIKNLKIQTDILEFESLRMRNKIIMQKGIYESARNGNKTRNGF